MRSLDMSLYLDGGRTLNRMHRSKIRSGSIRIEKPSSLTYGKVKLGEWLAAERHIDRSHAGNFETQLPDLLLKFLGLSQPGLMQKLQ